MKSIFDTVRRFARAFLAWRFSKLTARVTAFGAGLLVLTLIGRATLAGAAAPAPHDAATAPGATSPGSAAPPEEEPTEDATTDPSASLTQAALPSNEAPREVPAPAPLATMEPEESDAGPPRGHASHRASATPEDPVFLNEAALQDLERLPGVGQKRATAILALRARLGGRFHQVEDLMKVKGFGVKAMKRLRPLVRLDRPTAARGDAGGGAGAAHN
jgi:competence protein ComEA